MPICPTCDSQRAVESSNSCEKDIASYYCRTCGSLFDSPAAGDSKRKGIIERIGKYLRLHPDIDNFVAYGLPSFFLGAGAATILCAAAILGLL